MDNTQSDIWQAVLFGGIGLVAQYLPARFGIPAGLAAVLFGAWQLGYTDYSSWQSWITMLLILAVVYRTYRVIRERDKTQDHDNEIVNPQSDVDDYFSVTEVELSTLYNSIKRYLEIRDKVAENVSNCSYQDYLPYFQGKARFLELVKIWGENGAVLEEINFSLFNPLLDAKLEAEQELSELKKSISEIIGKTGSHELYKEVEHLLELQYEGYRNWVTGDLNGMLETKASSQIIRKRYGEMVSNQLGKVLTILNNIRRSVNAVS